MNNKYTAFLDWGLLTPVIVLVILGLTSLFSIQIDFFRNQLFFLIISLFVYFFFSQVDIETLKYYSLPIYVVSFFILLLLLFLGTEARGAVRWFTFFGVNIQLSEIVKPFLALSFASFLTSSKKNLTTLVVSFVFLTPIMYLIYKQPDLGNALLFLLVFFLTVFVYGFQLRYFVAGVFGLSIISPILWSFLKEYQRERFLTFLYPTKDPLGTSYNTIQAIIAIGSGMFFGRGISQGTQSTLRFLPEKHTDFIFAKISEDLGFIGSVVILLAFIFLLYRIYTIFSKTENQFIKVFSLCSFFFLFTQSFINIGMNLGILPIVGVTLPFVSYGGSSLLSSFIFLGFLSSANRLQKKAEVLEIGRRF